MTPPPPPSSPVRVAFLQASLGFGGAERLVQSTMTGMDPARVAAEAVTLQEPGPIGEQLRVAGFEVHAGLARGRFDPGVGSRLRDLFARRSTDVVYVPDSALALFWAGMARRRSSRPRLVVGFHSTGRAEDALQHALATAAALSVADRFVALGNAHRDWLVRRFRLAPERIEVIASGVDLERFHPAADRAAARRDAGLPEGVPLVGIVAALRPEKDHATFLAAAARVAARIPETRFAIVGDGPERAGLEARARELGLGDRVLFLGARDDVPAIQRALDVAVLSSKPVVETLPVTLLEALASGTPVVSTDVGSIRDIVTPEVGALVPSGDAMAIASAIADVLADGERRAHRGAAARIRAESRFALPDMVRRYEELFARVAGADA